jgi:8-oxo-dGTP diphosphatase
MGGPGLAHEVLAVVLQVRDDRLHVLLWQHGRGPAAGAWALPGGPLLDDSTGQETLGRSVAHHLAEKVDVRHLAHLEQLETRSDPDRHPRGRVLATAYLGLVAALSRRGDQPENESLPPDTAWHAVDALPPMAFDHRSITLSGVGRLRAKLGYTNLGFALAPAEFTASELRAIYRAALGHDVSTTNLKRILLRREQIVATGEIVPPGTSGGRPAAVYRFRVHHIQVTDQFAVLRPPLRAPSAGVDRRSS